MHCPFCGANDTKVIDSRLASEGAMVRRRRECLSCTERFTTFETAELVMPHIIKSDERREPFVCAGQRLKPEARRPVNEPPTAFLALATPPSMAGLLPLRGTPGKPGLDLTARRTSHPVLAHTRPTSTRRCM